MIYGQRYNLFDLRQKLIRFEKIFIWSKDILFESNKFCLIKTKHFITSKKVFQTIVYYDPRPESLSSWRMCYKCRGEAEAFISHTPGHPTFWLWVVYYFSWSPAESTPKTEAKPRFCRVQGEVRPSPRFCWSGRALETVK